MTNPADETAPGQAPPSLGPGSPGDLAERVEQDIASLDTELAEIDLLVQQAAAEGERHESPARSRSRRRSPTNRTGGVDPMELAEQNAQLVDADQARRRDGIAGRRPQRQGQGPQALPRRPGRPRDRAPRAARRGGRAHPRLVGRGGRRRRGWRRGRRRDRGPGVAGGVADGPGGPGGPPSRHRPGDARRAGPEPDEHRPPGPDRRAADRARPGRRPPGDPRAHRDGPVDARRDEVVHLRRPADGPRRPRAGAHAPPGRTRPRPASRDPGRLRFDRQRSAAADGARVRHLPDGRRVAGRVPARTARASGPPSRLGGRLARGDRALGARGRARPGRRRRGRGDAAAGRLRAGDASADGRSPSRRSRRHSRR